VNRREDGRWRTARQVARAVAWQRRKVRRQDLDLARQLVILPFGECRFGETVGYPAIWKALDFLRTFKNLNLAKFLAKLLEFALYIYKPRERTLHTYTRTQTLRAMITRNSFFSAYMEKYTKHMNKLLFFCISSSRILGSSFKTCRTHFSLREENELQRSNFRRNLKVKPSLYESWKDTKITHSSPGANNPKPTEVKRRCQQDDATKEGTRERRHHEKATWKTVVRSCALCTSPRRQWKRNLLWS
jgi:hypothetical protein